MSKAPGVRPSRAGRTAPARGSTPDTAGEQGLPAAVRVARSVGAPCAGGTLSVLIVEDSNDDARLEALALEESGYRVRWQRVENAAGMTTALKDGSWDLVLCDHKMPRFDSSRALAVLDASGLAIPLILVSGEVGEEMAAAAAIRAGAADFVSKDRIGRLGAAVGVHLREAEAQRVRAAAELAARESDGRLMEVLDLAPTIVYLFDADGLLLFVNREAAQVMGVEQETLIGKPIEELFGTDQAAALRATGLEVLATDGPIRVEETVRVADGERTFLATRFPLHDLDGRIYAVGGISTDITDRKRAEADRSRLAAIVKSSTDAIIAKDRDGVITVWNPGAERLYGYAASEAGGQPVSLLVPPARRGEEREILRRVLVGEQIENFQTERVCKDGSVVTVSLSVSPIRDADGRVIGASTIARDVTASIRAQAEIAFQAKLLDAVDAAVIATDAEAVIRYWSRGAQALYGYSPNEALGRPVVDLLVSEESRSDVATIVGRAMAEGPAEGELISRDKQGRLFPIDLRLRAVALDGRDEGPIGLIGVGVDISARREAEDAIRRHAAEQEEIAKLGRLALNGAPLEELFDHAVLTASRLLSADCAWVAEHLPDASGFVIRAAVGWPDERKGKRIVEVRSMSGYAVRTHGPIVVEDWEQEQRFPRPSWLVAGGVRSSAAVLVGDPASPLGVLGVHYTQPNAVPTDCHSFLDAVANVLAEAICGRAAQETIRHQVLHDGLTGLPNRTLFLDRVTHALDRNRRRQPLAVFFIDLDDFKLVNDSLGHDAGDELLRVVAPRFAGAIRPGDTLARLGGDEFAVLCEELSSELTATRIASQLLAALEQPAALHGDERVVSASIGVALSSRQSTAADLLRDADAAMYHAKRAGRGRAELFDRHMRARVLGRVRTEAGLRAALTNKEEIYVNYQPLVSLRTGQIVGAEALARWRHPDWGPVAPIEFIPVAEDSGLIHKLGSQIIRRATRESSAWQRNADFAGVAINISTRQLVNPDEVPALVREAIATEGLPAGFITIEITESVLIAHLDTARRALDQLREIGVHLSLDDFGTGYSSLSYLRELPLDNVKIDRSLIRNIVEDPEASAVAGAIIQMGHALNVEVIAEGVETLEHAAQLQALDCAVAQGFYFAKPMPAEELAPLLDARPDWMPVSASPTPTRRSRNRAAPTTRRPHSIGE
jgi:diguanylate cyclase (GGDEF)-like protein/PAS domain S-box-containing protein